MNFWETSTLEALGWAILHSLWQGAAIVLLVAAWPRSGARIRYGVACAGLVVMLFAPVATFIYLNGGPAPELVTTSATAGSLQPTVQPVSSAATTSWREMVEPLLPWVVGLWVCGVVVLSAKSAGGWWLLRSGLSTTSHEAPKEWQAALVRVSSRVGVSRPVRLVRSAVLSTPAVVGWLRPVILIPPAAVAGLSPHQLEAILAHELAHIRRHDYLVNLVQTVAETLLFYHPGVWWISGRIRQEREHCADDLAVSACGGPADYARALLMLEEARPSLAVAASGASLKTRIERLLHPVQPALSFPTVASLTALTVAFALVVPTLLAQQMPERHAKWLSEDVAYIITDTQRDAFKRLTADTARDDFIAEFWKELDPDPSTPENEVKVEHYRRIEYANERFGSDKAGWKTERGRIYILHGPPDEIESHPADGYEQWRYRGFLEGFGRNVIFDFDLADKRPVRVSN